MSVFTFDGTENRMRWDRSSASFMEVWYATVNHPQSGGGLWLRYTLTIPKGSDPYCELWGFFFDPEGGKSFAGKQRFPIDHLGANERNDGALARIGDAWLSETHLEGAISSESRIMEWSLDIEPAARCFQHIPALLRRRVEQRVSTLCSPNLAVPFTGTVKLDNVVLEFDGAMGQQSHRWGRRHAASWAWAHCADFEAEPDAVFEGVAARSYLGPLPMPTITLLYLGYEGEDLCFNELSSALRAKGRYEMPTWAFTASNDTWRIVGAARALPQRMVQVTYTDPDGTNRYCANSEIADMGIEVFKRNDRGWRHIDSLVSMRSAHLEFGRRDPFIEIPVSF